MRAEAAPSHLYAPDLGPAGSTLTLGPDESHYLLHVCRARIGDLAHATDGRGSVAEVRVLAGGKHVRATVERVQRTERARRAWVWCGAPEGQRGDWLVEKLAELGVETWQPLACERGVWSRGAARRERWERLAIAALRQSRRSFLMEVREPLAPGAALAGLPESATRWLANPQGEPAGRSPGTGLSVAAIGPGAGFTAAERQAFEGAGFRPIRLGEARLRTETAALAWAAWWAIG